MMRRKKKVVDDPSVPPQTVTAVVAKHRGGKKKDIVRFAPPPDAPPIAERPKDLNDLRVALQKSLDTTHGKGTNVATAYVAPVGAKDRCWCLVVFAPADHSANGKIPSEFKTIPVVYRGAVDVPKAWGKAAK